MAGAGGGMAVLPQYQGDYYTLQRQQAIAQALMGSALQPQQIQATGSGPYTVVPKYSIGGGLSQLGQALLAAKLNQNVSQGYQQLGANQLAAFGGGQPQSQTAQGGTTANPFAGGQGGTADGSGASGAPVPQSAPVMGGGSQMNPLGLPPALAWSAYNADPAKYAEIQAAAYKPADIVSQIRAAGVDPNSTLGHQVAQQALAKANYIAPVSARPGGAMQMPDGTMRYTLPAPQQGGMWATNPDGTLKLNQAGQPYQIGIGGAAEIEGGMSTAKASGPATFQMGDVWDPTANNGQGGYVRQSAKNQAEASGSYTPSNAPLPMRSNNPGAVSPGGSVAKYPDMQTGIAAMDQNLASYAKDPKVKTLGDAITKWVGSAPNAPAYIKDVSTRLSISPTTPIDLNNPAQRLAISSAIMLHENGSAAVFAGGGNGAAAPKAGPMASQPTFGTQKGQEDLQSDLTKKYGTLNEANSQAQNTISYLQNIRGLASKAALGQQSDKLNFVNGLLSLAGSEKATDQVTANNLLDKYSNQIVARLGTGGLGTDAARAILQSAYPNAHMTQGAINEAVDNLVGASQMTQAKAKLLQGDYNARNPQSYNQKEMAFDQNADPRIWQFQNMNPQQRQSFKASMTPDEQAQFGQHLRALVQLGVFK